MARRKKNVVIDSLEIEGIGGEGKAFGKVDGKLVFVPYTIPGDVVSVQLGRNRKKFAEGRVLEFHQQSVDRAEPFCDHFGTCGGCKWQMLPYAEQLKYKEDEVTETLRRMGGIIPQKTLPIIGSTNDKYYRNKLEFTFSCKRWMTQEEVNSEEKISNRNALGFHIPKRFDKILHVEKCYLQDDISNDIRNAIYSYCIDNEMPFYDILSHEGLMRNLIIRNTTTKELMVMVIFAYDDDKNHLLLEYLQQKFPQITSLYEVINDKKNDSLNGLTPKLFSGNPKITEKLGECQYEISPTSFFQTNSQQAYELYKVVNKLANIQPTETVYDLYTGAGTIACFIASKAKKVIGVEYSEEAIEDAKINAKLNNIDNTLFFAGDMKDILKPNFIQENGNPDVFIIDPPRSGMHPSVIETIKKVLPKRIVYVSCNVNTQARDLEALKDNYEVLISQPMDLFPHTHHIENVVLCEYKEK